MALICLCSLHLAGGNGPTTCHKALESRTHMYSHMGSSQSLTDPSLLFASENMGHHEEFIRVSGMTPPVSWLYFNGGPLDFKVE